MKSIRRMLAVIAICFLGSSAHAALTQLSFQPSPADLNDLDHHDVTTWRIDNISLNSNVITSATLTFKNIANWDSNPNMLFVWLLDTSLHSGVTIAQDVDPNQAPVTDISDAFLGSLPTLLSGSTAKTKLFQKSFTTTGADYVYTLSAAELTALTTYINNGHDIAFGFDPDCHYFNDGVTFTMNLTTPIPEAGTVVPVAILLFAATAFEIRRRRQLPTKCLATK